MHDPIRTNETERSSSGTSSSRPSRARLSRTGTAIVVALAVTSAAVGSAERSPARIVGPRAAADDPTPKLADPKDIYPPIRHPTTALAFSLPEDNKADIIRKALAELSTKDADCRIVYGPVKATARPKKVMLVIEAPAALDAKDVAKALKKGAGSAELVAWTCFAYADSLQGSKLDAGMPGLSPRDLVLSMSNDLHWFEVGAGMAEFFVSPGHAISAKLPDQFHKLAQPFGVKDLGPVVESTITWGIAPVPQPGADAAAPIDTAPIDEAAARRIEKVLVKVPGVKSARIDAAGRTLSVTVVLTELVRSGPVLPLRSAPPPDSGAAGSSTPDAGNPPPPRMRFDTNVLFDALEKEHLTAASPKKEGEDAGPKKGG